mmetsp:Transcript_42806/g.96661  ORF Transcript_42806/g.96661 Transcript_42806/m.96661 type:complete len:209 (+) Transcript_42806:640-1266(+)
MACWQMSQGLHSVSMMPYLEPLVLADPSWETSVHAMKCDISISVETRDRRNVSAHCSTACRSRWPSPSCSAISPTRGSLMSASSILFTASAKRGAILLWRCRILKIVSEYFRRSLGSASRSSRNDATCMLCSETSSGIASHPSTRSMCLIRRAKRTGSSSWASRATLASEEEARRISKNFSGCRGCLAFRAKTVSSARTNSSSRAAEI